MIALVLALSLGLRIISLNQSFWLDEATSALVVRDLSWFDILNQFLPGDFHPPVYYLILKIWAGFLGINEISLRSLSLIVGLAAIWLVYLLGKELFDRRTGLLASMLLATSGLHIYFSQEARMYNLALFWVILTVYFFVKSLQKGRIGDWVGFGLGLVMATLTHYLTILMLPVYWFTAMICRKQLPWPKKFLASHIILVISWFWWLPTFLKQLKQGLRVESSMPRWWQLLGQTSIKQIMLVPTKFMIGRISFDNKLIYGLVIGGVTLVFGLLFFRAFQSKVKTKILWLWLGIPIVISALLGLKTPVFSYFRLLFVLPAFYLLLALGIGSLPKKYLKAVLIFVLMVNLVSSGMYLSNPKFHREDWQGLVNFIESESRGKKTITLFVADSQMEAYHYYAKNGKIAGPSGLDSSYQEIWLMRYVQPIFDPEDILKKKIEALDYQKANEYDFNGVVVWRYLK